VRRGSTSPTRRPARHATAAVTLAGASPWRCRTQTSAEPPGRVRPVQGDVSTGSANHPQRAASATGAAQTSFVQRGIATSHAALAATRAGLAPSWSAASPACVSGARLPPVVAAASAETVSPAPCHCCVGVAVLPARTATRAWEASAGDGNSCGARARLFVVALGSPRRAGPGVPRRDPAEAFHHRALGKGPVPRRGAHPCRASTRRRTSQSLRAEKVACHIVTAAPNTPRSICARTAALHGPGLFGRPQWHTDRQSRAVINRVRLWRARRRCGARGGHRHRPDGDDAGSSDASRRRGCDGRVGRASLQQASRRSTAATSAAPVQPPRPSPQSPITKPEPPKLNAVFIGLGGGVSLGQVPDVAALAQVLGSWGTRNSLLTARFGTTTVGGVTVGRGGVRAVLLNAGLDGCVKWSVFGVCVGADVGSVQAWALDLPNPKPQGALFLGLGAGALLDVPAGDLVRVRLQVTGLVQPRLTLTVGRVPVWQSSQFAFTAALTLHFKAWGDVLR
jgi:hypothetical protein